MSEDYKLIQELANNDVKVLKEKGMTYGDSWRKRGGAGAFMMLSRKWDRVENICQHRRYDIFEAGMENVGDILDDIADLRRYLLLVEAHVAGAKESATPAPASKPVPVCPECRKDAITESTVVYRKGECPIHGEEECGPGAGYVNQDGPARTKLLPWREPGEQPVAGPFDVIQVMWHDGTYSAMLPHEFGKIAEWSEVKLCRVIRDRANPEDYPLPEPVRKWGGSRYGSSDECMACQGAHPKGTQCPNLTPHSGDHQHTINVGHYLDVGSHTHTVSGPTGHPIGAAQPSYSHTNGIIAGIASAVSGVNIALGGAAASINS